MAMIRRAGCEVRMLEGVRRPPLGIEPRPSVEATLQLNPGDALVLFSDGLAEEPSAARDGDRYGLDRIKASIIAHDADPSLILADLVAWADRDRFDDDLTILVIRRSKA